MYSNTRLILVGCASGAAALWADMIYGAGRAEGKASVSVDSEPSPDEMDAAEPDDAPSPTESDEE